MNMQCDLGLLIHTLVFLDVEFVENGATGAPTSKPLRDAGMFNFYYVCHEKYSLKCDSFEVEGISGTFCGVGGKQRPPFKIWQRQAN